ncbi:cadherin-like domain-containing protein [Zavarzinia compransoris]|uniref:Uncharacterized protein n=1 Tax=Zavarzinia compransoris TaxID=1264899 RepID=A0A317EEV2_9PROT|nr:cadherin-like domain-containing protein [Zavarzinia compransoris]PWR23903.1 hypothetical protein DKG75_04960 [Zavarzinia compransoris]TDP48147.1 hemolysin type calcium-binding protein [Zavarzinia compransoris]
MSVSGIAETEGSVFFVDARKQAAELLRRRPAAPRGNRAGAGLGLASMAVLLGACGLNDSDGGSAPPAAVTGRVVKDYAAGTNVFADANNNGVRDAGEQGAVTGTDGSFVASNFTGIMTATGGIDTGNGVALSDIVLRAPAGATVITPLTTLMVAGATEAEVIAAFGLAAGTDIDRLDALAGVKAGTAGAAAVLTAGHVATVTIRALAALNGESFTAAATRLADSLTGQAVDFTSKDVLKAYIKGADAVTADRAASLIGAVNDALLDRAANPLGAGLQAASLLGQTVLIADLQRFLAAPAEEAWAALTARYSGQTLTDLITAAEGALPAANAEVIAGIDHLLTDAGKPAVVKAADLLKNDHSVDGDALSLTGVEVPAAQAGRLAVVFDAATGTLTVTPAAGFTGLASFTYLGKDAEGNAFKGTVLVDVDGSILPDGAGNDTITGTGERNVIISGAGDDTLYGLGGDDRLISLAGSDAIDGGSGADILVAAGRDGAEVVLRGGSGADLFVLAPAKADLALDVEAIIVDFAKGADRIDLSALRDGDGSVLTIDDILAATGNANGDAVIDLSHFVTAAGKDVEGGITLTGIDSADLGAGDFVLAGGTDWRAGIEDLLATAVTV